MRKLFKLLTIGALFIIAPFSYAAKLAIVIDDFGYREHNEEQVILFSPEITVAVLPNSPNASKISTFAHNHGNDIIIHLPMAPMSKQPLEIDTLTPSMSDDEIHAIIKQAIDNVPYAIGVNNHMGSLMTSDLPGMQRVMKSLSDYSLFFLDSRTIAKSQAIVAANQYRVDSVVRDVFLDDVQNEQAIAYQFDLAIKLARKNGSAVVIGHPYSETVKVLQSKLGLLPDDIELVKVKSLVVPAKKVKLSGIIEQYKIKYSQALFELMIINQSFPLDSNDT